MPALTVPLGRLGRSTSCAAPGRLADNDSSVHAGLQRILAALKGQTGLFPDLQDVLQSCDSRLLAAAVASQIKAAGLLRIVLGSSHPCFSAAAFAAFNAGLPYPLATAMTQTALSLLKDDEKLQ